MGARHLQKHCFSCLHPGGGPSWGDLDFSPLKWVAGAPKWPMSHATCLGFFSLALPLPHPRASQPQAEPKMQTLQQRADLEGGREGQN